MQQGERRGQLNDIQTGRHWRQRRIAVIPTVIDHKHINLHLLIHGHRLMMPGNVHIQQSINMCKQLVVKKVMTAECTVKVCPPVKNCWSEQAAI